MVNSDDLGMLIQEYNSMGFDPQDIIMAWFNSNQRKGLVLDHLLTIAYYLLFIPQLKFSKEKGKTQNINTAPAPKDVILFL